MPKTFVDDIGPAFPSAISGPLQVMAAGDAGSFFKLDPATGSVEAAGSARPVRRIVLPASRSFGTAGTSIIDTGMDARSLSASLDTGFYAATFAVPQNMDRGEPSRVMVALAPQADGGGATVLRLQLVTTILKHGDTTAETNTITLDWAPPSDWSTQDLKVVTMDAGGGVTYAGDAFEAEDLVGLLFRRVGSAAEDTFPNLLLACPSLLFEYTAKGF